jgi:hypothetical protein
VTAKAPGNVSYVSPVDQARGDRGLRPVPGNDWVVVVSESRDYFAAPINRLSRT